MRSLFIPACGDRITLADDWDFLLYLESRNYKFAEARNLVPAGSGGRWNMMWEGEPWRSGYRKVPVSLPKGSVLEVDRVYLRAHSKSATDETNDFDSITWKVVGQKHSRFWTKLADVNQIKFELGENWSYKDRKAAGIK
jgi:hypothetical protein